MKEERNHTEGKDCGSGCEVAGVEREEGLTRGGWKGEEDKCKQEKARDKEKVKDCKNKCEVAA